MSAQFTEHEKRAIAAVVKNLYPYHNWAWRQCYDYWYAIWIGDTARAERIKIVAEAMIAAKQLKP